MQSISHSRVGSQEPLIFFCDTERESTHWKDYIGLDSLTRLFLSLDCPPGWLRYGSACYYIDDTPTSKQADARTTCRNTGADLPVIRSAADDKFIFNLMKNQSTVTHLGLWLGMNRSAVGSKFYWVDGTPLEGQYQNWADGEPNNNNNGEHCGNMYGTPGDRNVKPGKWNDLPCEYGYFGNKSVPVILCQKPISKTV